MRMKLNLKQQKVSLDLSSRTILTQDHSKLLNIEAHASGHTGFVYDEDFVAYQEEVKTTTDNLQTQIDDLDVGYITEEEMQQHLTEQAAIDKAQDDALNAEITNREEADMTLQTNLNTETQAREQGDSDLQTALSAEATERAKDDDTLNSKIEDETERATNAENTLQSHIDTHYADQAVINAALQDKDDELNTEIKNVDNKLDNETSARQAGDATLQQNIDANTTKITNNTSLIDDEVADRKAADTTLQNNINANTTLINQEVSDRQTNDNVLNTQITKNSEDITTLGTQLDEETSNRESADSALDTRLSVVETGLTTETANRTKDDDTLHDLIVAEQTARENADTSLQGQVDTHQANITSLQTALTNETSAREAQDVVLQTNIDDEASARENADEDLQTRIDQLSGLGGYLTAHNFGTATPTQDDLTNYAMTQISVPDKYGIFNMTRVTNLYDGNLWILTNTQDTTPTVFEWSNNGNDTVSIATKDAAGILKSSNTQYELKVNSTKQTGSINGLTTKLNAIDSKDSTQDTSIASLQNTKLDKNTSTSSNAQAYVKNADGSQGMQNISGNADANTIAQRGTGGVLNVGTPTADTHAATKKYVDDKQIAFDTNAPKMNGTASVGSSTSASRGDHVHPSDTSKANLNGWTVNRVLITSAAGVLTAGSITSTELWYLSGVSSNLQTQLNGKLSTGGTAADSNKLGGQLPSYYLDYDNLANTPTIPSTDYINTQDTNNRLLLGQYDTRSGNVITRQTNYLKIDGSSNLQYDGNFYITNLPKALTIYADGIVSGSTYTYWSGWGVNKTLGVGTDGTLYLFDSDYTSVDSLKASLAQNPIYIQYKATTSYTEYLEDYHYARLNQYFDWLGEENAKSLNEYTGSSWSIGYNFRDNSTDDNWASCLDYIPIQESTYYSLVYYNYTYNSKIVRFYNSDLTQVGNDIDGAFNSFTTPSNASYMKIGSWTSSGSSGIPTVMLNKGAPRPYQKPLGEISRTIQTNSNEYRLGYYDSVAKTPSGNVAQIKTFYIKLDGSEPEGTWAVWDSAGVNGFKYVYYKCPPIEVISSETGVLYTVYSKFITNGISNSYNENELYGADNKIGIAFTPLNSNFSEYQICLRYSNTSKSVSELRQWLSANPIYIQACSQEVLEYKQLDDRHYSSIEPLYDFARDQLNKSVNIFDEKTELGSLNTSNGEKTDSSSSLRSANYISVSPNTYYTFSSSDVADMCFYNSSKSFLSYIYIANGMFGFTTPDNCYYLLFRWTDGYGTTYKNNTIINKGRPIPYQKYCGEVVRQSDITMLDDYDNTKGTIEARLTNLGFKSGTITLSSNIASIITNYVAQQGKNGILNYEGTITATNVTSSSQLVQIGTLPSGFEAMPTYCRCKVTSTNSGGNVISSNMAQCYIRTNAVYITNFEGTGYFNSFSILNMGFKIVS